ncbi:Macrolide export ATP-binding/permease protein MacB [Thalassoglobus neptunius]|uniref:Macrolide export ATP-binding/permease protein MacB n=1 Tax=Thalassoglobus neptunius TaxID=1938619 RepID=A0A5C5WND1_9PLAN|nr:ABC transporter permease [Thalassoglobus neptunius]TWT51589.1 Macrolide export ATP-binding/permease protein MacB [Thalassoglobus neptunius]
MIGFAFRNLASRPMRTLLSVLGLAVAIGGMVGLFSIAGGLDSIVRRTFEQIPGLLVQQAGAPIPLFSSLPAHWADDLKELPGVRTVDSQAYFRVNQLDGEVIINPPRLGVGIDIEPNLRLERGAYRENLIDGRFLDLTDIAKNRCLISQEVSDQLAKGVGERFTLNGAEFEIVGIYSTGSILLDVNILMSLETCRAVGRISPDTVACFYVESNGTLTDDELKQSIEDVLAGRSLSEGGNSGGTGLGNLYRALGQTLSGQSQGSEGSETDSERSPVEIRTADDWGTRVREFSQDLNLFLMIMTAIGVSIATLSIVNTMMMSVSERTTEFGVLRANGWSQTNIVQLMTIESGLIGLLGGALGASCGWIGTLIVNSVWPDRLQLHAGLGLLVSSVVFSVVLGLIGGLFPAWSAAKLSPMQSIRRGGA